MTEKNTVIICGIDALQKRRSVTICAVLWSLFIIDQEGSAKARAALRRWMVIQTEVSSINARLFIFEKIVKPGLIRAFLSADLEYSDIQDSL